MAEIAAAKEALATRAVAKADAAPEVYTISLALPLSLSLSLSVCVCVCVCVCV